MYPHLIAFHLESLGVVVRIDAYPLSHFLAFVVLLSLTLALHAREAGSAWRALDPLLIGVPAGMLGAPLLGAWMSGTTLPNPFTDPAAFWAASKAAYGLLATGIIAAAGVVWLRGLSVAGFLDGAAPTIALALAVARLGCFMAGCCYGNPTASWLGVHFPEGHPGMERLAEGDPRGLHPTQLYLAGAALLTGISLLVYRRRGSPAPGMCFAAGVGLYALSVLAIEFLRGDAQRWYVAGLSHNQWISLTLGLGVLAFLFLRRLRERSAARLSLRTSG